MENSEEPAADGPPAKWSARKVAKALLALAFVLMAVWAALWDARLVQTRARVGELLGKRERGAVTQSALPAA